MLVMALDVGTSSARAMCFDAAGKAVPEAEAHAAYDPIVTADGAVELDADTLLEAVAGAIDGCLAGCRRRATEVQAVGASVFWHSLLALDDDGAPLTRLMTWADTRSARAAGELRRTLDERAVHARTGAPLHSAFFPAKLRWLRRSRPDIFERARRWCGFGEYLSARLTGRSTASVSMASGTGLMNHHTGGWDPVLLDACEVEAGQLPPIDGAPAPGLAPRYASRWPALARARWYPAHGDGACSNLGSDCATRDRVALNVGTSAAMRIVCREGFGGAASTPWGLWRYRVDDRRSLVGGATSEGGNVLAWCRRVLALPEGDEELIRLVSEVPADAHGLTALPFLAGERSVGWHGDARAVLGGLSLATTAVDIARAMMEAVACRLALVYERLSPLAAAGHAVVASGGALAHAPVWATIIADALGVPITLSREREASARGAALLALEAEGVAAPPPLPPGHTISPDPHRHEIYRSARERQQRLYDTVVAPLLS
ncbi:MAG TPA: gluconokinase [Methylomirabilota bacterium]|jgi:gluconokinase|nr:gluconokinase [Methylomirabilota bacterium]